MGDYFDLDFLNMDIPKVEIKEKWDRKCCIDEFVTEAVEDEINACTGVNSKALLNQIKVPLIDYLKKEYFNVPEGQFITHVCGLVNLEKSHVPAFTQMFVSLENIASKMEACRKWIITPTEEFENQRLLDRCAKANAHLRSETKENSPGPSQPQPPGRQVPHDPRPCRVKYSPPKSMFEVRQPEPSILVERTIYPAASTTATGPSSTMPQHAEDEEDYLLSPTFGISSPPVSPTRLPLRSAMKQPRENYADADRSVSPLLRSAMKQRRDDNVDVDRYGSRTFSPPLRSAMKQRRDDDYDYADRSGSHTFSSPRPDRSAMKQRRHDDYAESPEKARDRSYYRNKLASNNAARNVISSTVNPIARKENPPVKKPSKPFSSSDFVPSLSNTRRHSSLDTVASVNHVTRKDKSPVKKPAMPSFSRRRSMLDSASEDSEIEEEEEQQQPVTKKRKISFHDGTVDNEFTPRFKPYVADITMSVPLNEHRAIDKKYEIGETCTDNYAALANQPIPVTAPAQCVYEKWNPRAEQRYNDFEEEVAEILRKFRYNSFRPDTDNPKRPLHLVIKDSLLYPTNFQKKYRQCWQIDTKYPLKIESVIDVIEDEIADQRNDYYIKNIVFSLGFDLVLREPDVATAIKILKLSLKNFIVAIQRAFDPHGPKRYKNYQGIEEDVDALGENAPFIPEMPKLIVLTIPFIAFHRTATTYEFQISKMNEALRNYVSEKKAKLFKEFGQIIEIYDWQQESSRFGELSPAHVEARFKVLTSALCDKYQMFTVKNVEEEEEF